MARLMSVALTEAAVVEHRKTVTRRLGWRALQPGDELDLCRKVMGRKAGEPLVRLARVRVVSTRWERLNEITDDDVRLEGFDRAALQDHAPEGRGCSGCTIWGASPTCPSHWWTVDGALTDAFVRFFTASMGCAPDALVNRIEWEYLS